MIYKEINIKNLEEKIQNNKHLNFLDVSLKKPLGRKEALHIPLEHDDFIHLLLNTIPMNEGVVVYSSDNDQINTLAAGRIMNSQGYNEVYEFYGKPEDLKKIYSNTQIPKINKLNKKTLILTEH